MAQESNQVSAASLTTTEIRAQIERTRAEMSQTIDAIQYLANAVVWRGRGDERKPVVVDAAGYRARREETLTAIATRSAERVAASGRSVSHNRVLPSVDSLNNDVRAVAASGRSVELDSMTAVERKVVHVALKDFPGVVTRSEGTEPNRFVVIDAV